MSSADKGTPKGREFTGRHMLMVTVGAFAVIIGVNIYMAWSAISTFPGLEVKNSYVASQEFNRLREAQLALGWKVDAAIEPQGVVLTVTGPDGAPVRPADISATLGRATERKDDLTLVFEEGAAGTFIAPTPELAPGYWVMWLEMHAGDGTLFRQRIELTKAGG